MRHDALDVARGGAYVLMLVHHAAYFGSLAGAGPVPAAAAACGAASRTTFILLAGATLGMRGGRAARALEIGLHAAAVSLATRLLLPEAWVRFGILHFMCAALLLTALLLRLPPPLAAALGAALLVAPATGVAPLDAALGHAPPVALDYFPLQRWLPLFWTGVLLGRLVRPPRGRAATPPARLLAALGRATLPLYTAHFLAACALVRAWK
jgi:uncharacterized membrane protein